MTTVPDQCCYPRGAAAMVVVKRRCRVLQHEHCGSGWWWWLWWLWLWCGVVVVVVTLSRSIILTILISTMVVVLAGHGVCRQRSGLEDHCIVRKCLTASSVMSMCVCLAGSAWLWHACAVCCVMCVCVCVPHASTCTARRFSYPGGEPSVIHCTVGWHGVLHVNAVVCCAEHSWQPRPPRPTAICSLRSSTNSTLTQRYSSGRRTPRLQVRR